MPHTTPLGVNAPWGQTATARVKTWLGNHVAARGKKTWKAKTKLTGLNITHQLCNLFVVQNMAPTKPFGGIYLGDSEGTWDSEWLWVWSNNFLNYTRNYSSHIISSLNRIEALQSGNWVSFILQLKYHIWYVLCLNWSGGVAFDQTLITVRWMWKRR